MPTVLTSQIKILKQKGKVATDHRRKRELQQKNVADKDITDTYAAKAVLRRKSSDGPQKTISDEPTLHLQQLEKEEINKSKVSRSKDSTDQNRNK